MMVDCGRKFYTVEWIKTHLREMAYNKMNLFHWHLSDGISKTNNGGFRLTCKVHPEITSVDHYSQTDVQDIIALATKYHITILPEFDFPGHCNWLYAAHKNLLLGQQVLGSQYWALDLSKDTTFKFVKEILNEIIPQFPGPFWHIGADEYMFSNEYANFPQLATAAKAKYGTNALPIDCYRGFVDTVNRLVKSYGKTMWAWDDVLVGITGTKTGSCPLDPDITIDHWFDYGGQTPQNVVDAKYYLVNCSGDLGFIISSGGVAPVVSAQTLYSNYDMGKLFDGNLSVTEPYLIGMKFPIWADAPDAATETTVATAIFMHIRVIAQLGWASPKVATDYTTFSTLANTTLGNAPIPAAYITTAVTPKMNRPVYGIVSTQNFESVQILNLSGRLFKTIPAKSICIDAGNRLNILDKNNVLRTGLYLCRFKGKGVNQSQ